MKIRPGEKVLSFFSVEISRKLDRLPMLVK